MKELLLVLTLGNVADLATTEWALAQPGIAEANPLMRTRSARITLKVGAVAGQTYLANRLRRQGHPKAARVLAYVVAGANGYLALRNLRTARRAGDPAL